jgi:hypothetical protein
VLKDVLAHLILPAVTLSTIPPGNLGSDYPQRHAGSAIARLHPHGKGKGIARALGDFQARAEKCPVASSNNHWLAVRDTP